MASIFSRPQCVNMLQNDALSPHVIMIMWINRPSTCCTVVRNGLPHVNWGNNNLSSPKEECCYGGGGGGGGGCGGYAHLDCLTAYYYFDYLQLSSNICSLLDINSSPHGAAYMRHWIGSALLQIMACRLFGAKPLSKLMLGFCQLDT